MNPNALRIKDRVAQAIDGEDASDALAVLALLLAWFSCRAGLTKEQVLANVGDVYDRAARRADQAHRIRTKTPPRCPSPPPTSRAE